jgi:peptide deformylase
MMYRILPYEENPALREIASAIPLEEIQGERIQTLISQMKKLLAKEDYGVAMAAPQVGESLQLFIVSGKALARNKRNAPDEPESPAPKKVFEKNIQDQVYINPTLTKMSRAKREKHEGCLSIRGKWGTVPRADKATIHAFDETGREFTRGASGFLAHIFQHEMDHLQGVLYIDKAADMYDDEKNENE